MGTPSYQGILVLFVYLYYHILFIDSPVVAFSSSTIASITPTKSTVENDASPDNNDDHAAKVWKTIATSEGIEKDLTFTDYEIPDGLRGTYYVNGFGSCRIGKERLVHPFESHGFFKAITFEEDGSIKFRAKYVNTPVRKLEHIFQRPLFRGAMSSVATMNTVIGNFWNALAPTTRDTANLAVRKWGDKNKQKRLILSCDNAPHYSLHPDTLETIGIETMDTKILEGKKMLAHTRVDSERQRMVSVSLDYLPLEQATVIHFYEFDQAGTLISDREYKTSPAVVFHDWMLTPNYYIVPAAEAVFDLSKIPDLILGKSTATEVFSLDEMAPAKVLLIPRDPDQDVIESRMSDATHGVSFHFGPSYECKTDNGRNIVLHLFVFDRYQFGDEMGFRLEEQDFAPTPWSLSNGGPKLQRWTVSINNDDTTTMRSEKLSDLKADMPTFHPKKDGLFCRYMYSVCGIREKGFFPFNALCKYDLLASDEDQIVEIWPPAAAKAVHSTNYKDWDGGPGVYAEPLFVPRKGHSGDSENEVDNGNNDDDGFLLTTFHDAEAGTTTLEIFDAKTFSDGPIQKIPLGELMGWNVHSCFDPA